MRIGSPVTGYGQESRNRAARQRIPNRTWTDEDGVERVEASLVEKSYLFSCNILYVTIVIHLVGIVLHLYIFMYIFSSSLSNNKFAV